MWYLAYGELILRSQAGIDASTRRRIDAESLIMRVLQEQSVCRVSITSALCINIIPTGGRCGDGRLHTPTNIY